MQVDKEICNELIYNRKKPNITKQAWAKFLKEYMTDANLSQRQFCSTFNLPKSTLTGWLVYDKLTVEEYDELKDNLIDEKTITDTLKSSKKRGKDAINEIKGAHYRKTHLKKPSYDMAFECIIDQMIDTLTPFMMHPPKNGNGLALKLSRLKEIIIKIEKKI